MTDRPTVCPHGVDQSIKMETVQDGDVLKVTGRQTECLRCAEEAGILILLPSMEVRHG